MERTWLKNQTEGVWDENKLVEGLTGEKTIFKRRSDDPDTAGWTGEGKKKRMMFVLDVSARSPGCVVGGFWHKASVRCGGGNRNTARQAMDGLWTEVCGQQKQSNDPGNNQHILNTPTIGRR